jgi:hypothetical protein
MKNQQNQMRANFYQSLHSIKVSWDLVKANKLKLSHEVWKSAIVVWGVKHMMQHVLKCKIEQLYCDVTK